LDYLIDMLGRFGPAPQPFPTGNDLMSDSTSKAELPPEDKPKLIDGLQRRHPKLISQTAINFAANACSAVFGLLNVIVFTRLLSTAEFGIYALGLGFAAIVSTLTCSWVRLYIMRTEPRGSAVDVRSMALPGLLLSCLIAPIAYVAGLFSGLQSGAAIAAIIFGLAFSIFDTTIELLRARFQAFRVMKATVMRAALLLAFGVVFILLFGSGIALLISAALAYFTATLLLTRYTWLGTSMRFDGAQLFSLAKAGVPLTLSLTLLAISSTVDRFIIAHLAGTAAAGQYSAGVDLVRQALIIPAISAAATFMPMSVQILSNRGIEATREHLTECLELLLAISLPAAFGFAVVSHHVAYVILGPDFRDLAAVVMPIICIMMIFQILTYQYVHIGFLLSDRNSLYLINTASTMIVNGVLAYVLIVRMGPVGAAWGRLAAEIFGFITAVVLTRWAFHVPFPLRPVGRVLIAALMMVAVIKVLDEMLTVSSKVALIVLIPAGMITYFAMCWILNIAKGRQRLIRALEMAQGALAAKSSA
jgi:O-antigen/teichoic acid export membrane protein